MKQASAIAKGKKLEDYVALQIREKGIDPKAVRSHGSGNTNTEKGDIWTSMQVLGQNAGIECKNQKTLAIPNWWKQVEKLESLGREPILVFKFPNDSLENSKVCIYLDTFLELVAGYEGQKQDYQDPKAKWALQNAREALRVALKYLE